MTEPHSEYYCQYNDEMTEQSNVWVVDDDKSIRWVLEKALGKENLSIVSFDSSEKLLARFEEEKPDVIISDIRMPGLDGISLMEQIKAKVPELPVIIMTAYSDLTVLFLLFRVGHLSILPNHSMWMKW